MCFQGINWWSNPFCNGSKCHGCSSGQPYLRYTYTSCIPIPLGKYLLGNTSGIPLVTYRGWGRAPKLVQKFFPKTKQNKMRLQCPPHQITSALLSCRILFCFVLLAREGGRPASGICLFISGISYFLYFFQRGIRYTHTPGKR